MSSLLLLDFNERIINAVLIWAKMFSLSLQANLINCGKNTFKNHGQAPRARAATVAGGGQWVSAGDTLELNALPQQLLLNTSFQGFMHLVFVVSRFNWSLISVLVY